MTFEAQTARHYHAMGENPATAASWQQEDIDIEWAKITASTPEGKTDQGGPPSDPVRFPCPHLDLINDNVKKGQAELISNIDHRFSNNVWLSHTAARRAMNNGRFSNVATGRLCNTAKV